MSTTVKPKPASSYRPAQKLSQIHPHPRNPRHDATADEDLVASIRDRGIVQPLIVVPRDGEPGYWMVAGHRRADAARQLRLEAVPVVVRTDLTGEEDVLAAMLVENGRRKDLSPVEEAEGYEQLSLFGLDQAAIAARVGVSRTTVGARMKLMKLPEPTRARVHDGQVTLDEALTMVKYTGDKAALTRLESAAGTPNFRQTEAMVKREAEHAAAAAGIRRDMKAAGVPEWKLPDGEFVGSVNHKPDMPSQVHLTGVPASRDDLDAAKTAHDGCLAYCLVLGYGQPMAELMCLDPAKHAEDQYAQESADQRARRLEQEKEDEARQAEREAEQAARAAARAAADAAAQVRVESLMDWARTRGRKDPEVLQRLTTMVATALLLSVDLFIDEPGKFFTALELDPSEDVEFTDLYNENPDDLARADRWASGAADHPASAAVHAAALLTSIESWIRNEAYACEWSANARVIVAYFDLLEHAGHPMSDLDVALRDTYRGFVDAGLAAAEYEADSAEAADGRPVEDVQVAGGVL